MNKSIFAVLSALIALVCSAGLIFLIRRSSFASDLKNGKNKKLYLAGCYAAEWISAVVSVLSMLYSLNRLSPDPAVNTAVYIIGVIGMTVLLLSVYCGTAVSKKAENLFVLLMIPIGISYMFLLFPDYVPDEQSHFAKAFMASTFDFSGKNTGMMFGDYGIQKIGTFQDMFRSFYFGADTTLNVPFSEASQYNYVLYLFPAIGLLIGRLLHFSIYICYYMGRMMNFGLFLFIGYHAIRITPKCKWLFFVFYFNPMLIQLGISYSADLFVNSVCIFSVAYFLHLYEKTEIEKKDIIVVMSLIAGVLISKYVYLPIFGIYFAVFPKLFRMPGKNWILFSGCAACVLLVFFISLKMSAATKPIPSIQAYLDTTGVDVGKQIQWLAEDPGRIVHVFAATYRAMMDFYIKSFVSCLGWLTIQINDFSYHYYYILLFIAACFESSGCRIINRGWTIVLGLMISAFVVIGMYTQWTAIGAMVVQGVQGRYFIPAAVLFLLGISNGILKKIRWCGVFCIISILVIQLPVLLDIYHAVLFLA